MIKVLIVDDDNELLEMVSLVLSSRNMDVTTLNHAVNIQSAITAASPDLILMDIYLGDYDGRDLCHQLKTSDQFRQIPVILYSAGFITAESVKDSLADDFLQKPFEIVDLYKKIDNLVRQQDNPPT